jgi:hypothetical protein
VDEELGPLYREHMAEKLWRFARSRRRAPILSEIDMERERQRELYPDQEPGLPGELSDDAMFVVLAEEFGSVAKALHEGDIERLREELVQVAACCVKFREKMDREAVETNQLGSATSAAPPQQLRYPDYIERRPEVWGDGDPSARSYGGSDPD